MVESGNSEASILGTAIGAHLAPDQEIGRNSAAAFACVLSRYKALASRQDPQQRRGLEGRKMPSFSAARQLIPHFYPADGKSSHLREMPPGHIQAVIPQADNKSQRGQRLAQPIVKLLSGGCGIKVLGVRDTLR